MTGGYLPHTSITSVLVPRHSTTNNSMIEILNEDLSEAVLEDSQISSHLISSHGDTVSNSGQEVGILSLEENIVKYVCNNCDANYMTDEDLGSHLTTCQKHNCNQCDFEATTADSFVTHIENSHPQQIKQSVPLEPEVKTLNSWSCTSCSLSFASETEMKSHNNEVHQFNPRMPGGVKCTECLEGFPDNNTLYSHNLGNHMKICDECDYKSLKLEEIKNHSIRNHPKQSLAICGECYQLFESFDEASTHINSHNPEENSLPIQTFTCDLDPQCNNVYLNIGSLMEHTVSVHGSQATQNDSTEKFKYLVKMMSTFHEKLDFCLTEIGKLNSSVVNVQQFQSQILPKTTTISSKTTSTTTTTCTTTCTTTRATTSTSTTSTCTIPTSSTTASTTSCATSPTTCTTSPTTCTSTTTSCTHSTTASVTSTSTTITAA